MDGTQNVIKSNFHNLLCKLMKSLGQVYPESSELLGATVFLTSLEPGEERDEIMRQFYDAVKDNMDDIQDRNITVVRKVIADTPVLRKLGLVEIVNDPDFEQSHEVFFKYLDNLTSMCRMQYEVSSRMMDAIESVGRDVAARVQNGYTPTSAEDVEALGKAVVDKLGVNSEGGKMPNFVVDETNKLLDILTANNEFESLISQYVASAHQTGSS